MLHTKFRFIWQSGFRGEDLKKFNQSETRIVCGQSSRNVSVLSDMTSKIWADFAKDWHKIGILQ